MNKQIDLEHGAHILGDNKAARKILTMFIEKLPNYISDIQNLRETESWIQLHESIHALKGASCYSSTPLLNQTVSELNQLLYNVDQQTLSKETIEKIDAQLITLSKQSQEVITLASEMPEST